MFYQVFVTLLILWVFMWRLDEERKILSGANDNVEKQQQQASNEVRLGGFENGHDPFSRERFMFDQFIKMYNKTYVYGSDDYFYRFQIFQRKIKTRRVKGEAFSMRYPRIDGFRGSAIYGINQFSDLLPKEFKEMYLKMTAPKMVLKVGRHRKLTSRVLRRGLRKQGIPLRWDWRNFNIITPIKNQGFCGACYAISTVEVIESMYTLKANCRPKKLSVQQVLDCAPDSHGCEGGNPLDVLSWLNKTRAKTGVRTSLLSEWDYPTRYVDQECRAENPKGGVEIKDFYCVDFMDEMEIVRRIFKQGPVSAAVDAASWQDYLGGVIQHHCGSRVNHAVAIVGYDVTGRIPFFIVRNSWGKTFGDSGFAYIRIGKNLCGISTQICGASV